MSTNAVSVGKPNATAMIFVGAIGSTAPTDAATKLNSAFVSVGYISEDGVTNENTPETETIKAWGGAVVLTVQNEKSDRFSFTMISSQNADALKAVYGDDNVSETNGVIAITANAKTVEKRAWVVEMVLSDDVPKRIYIPNGAIAEVGEISYVDGEAIGYEVTIEAMMDESGNTHYEWIGRTSA